MPKSRMGIVAVKIKIMPEDPEINLKELKEKLERKIHSLGGKINQAEEEPIAFGLKALIITIAWPEEKSTDILESELQTEEVSSVQIIDYRRAFG